MPLQIQPFAESKELDLLQNELKTNVGTTERIASAAGGVALIGLGFAQRGWSGALIALLGGALLHRGTTGHCEAYKRMGMDTARHDWKGGVPDDKGIKVEKTITVARSPRECYNYWRELENLPQIMSHIESVTNLGNGRSHWVAKGPAGSHFEWDAEILIERDGEMMSWESLPGSDVPNAGSVWFTQANGGGSTEVKVSLQYQPPAGAAGAAIAKLLGESPEKQLEGDLGRFKREMESQQSFAL